MFLTEGRQRETEGRQRETEGDRRETKGRQRETEGDRRETKGTEGRLSAHVYLISRPGQAVHRLEMEVGI